MSDTQAVKETREWRKRVYEQTRNLSTDELRAHEEEVLRLAKSAGVDFEAVRPLEERAGKH